MKAGIYKTPNGDLIYVAKDRTIKATNLAPSSWLGAKVSHRAKDDTVLIAGTDYRCTRFSDVPNGCLDHAKAIEDAAGIAAKNPARLLQGEVEAAGYETGKPPFDSAQLDQRDRMRALGHRRCHKRSARKHRRQGHVVITDGDGTFWWKVAEGV